MIFDLRFICRSLDMLYPDGIIQRIVFRLDVDENVMGMPRMLFIVSAGCLGVLLVVCCALGINCYQSRQLDRNYYSFSMLSQRNTDDKKLFDDDDEGDETEIFRTPIKSKCIFM